MSKDLNNQLHIMFLPYMAPGHMMPMVDIARVFASQENTRSTIITTPANALSIENSRITFLTTSLPLKEVGLPEGCENLVCASTRETTFKLFRAIEMLHPKLENMLVENKPDCIVSDYLYPWTVDVAERLGIPRLAFSGGCFFSSCISYNLEKYRPHDLIESEYQAFIVPKLPDQISLTRSQLQDIVKGNTNFNKLFERLKEAERKSFGVLINSFYEIEHDYADYYRNQMGIKSWHIGPLYIYDKRISAIDSHNCLQWLDFKKSRSVLYICFGSLSRFNKSQITEMANALKDIGRPFIWVLGRVLKSNETDETQDEETEEWWLPEWFEDTLKENGDLGIVIKGWAPQVAILEHHAIGGFLTHCGWNSILEGISAGVPLITWPMFADQFHNEKLVTQVLKIGVEVGNIMWKAWATDETKVIEKDKIKTAIKRVMGGGGEAHEIRRKVNEFSKLAHKAVKEGGSSYNNVKSLLEVIRVYNKDRKFRRVD